MVEERYEAVEWLFRKAIGIIYFIAFVSFGLQAAGLIGSQGILPLSTFLQRVSEAMGPAAYRLLPTIFWFNSSTAAVQIACAAGALCAGLVFTGFAWRSALVACY